jgi:DNA-binding CsgD family transcriptional regulator
MVNNTASEKDAVFSELAWNAIAQATGLSPREKQIAQELVLDHKESLIARRLTISIHTVHTHIERLYRKLQISSRMELAMALMQCYLRLSADPASPLPPICDRHAKGTCPLASRHTSS